MKCANLINILVMLCITVVSCNIKPDGQVEHGTLELPDTITVGTIFGPTSYFIYRDEPMGYDYELAQKVLAENGHPIKVKVAPSIDSLIVMLNDGKVDLAACEIPIIGRNRERVKFCGPETITYQVLVQANGDSMITDVTELVGKDIWVVENSKYEHRLRNLNREIGGGINIHTLAPDSVIADDLIEMVSKGAIPFTIVDSDIAKLNRTYFNNINIDLEISFPQRASWAVKSDNVGLADSISKWMATTSEEATAKTLLKQYFETQKNNGVINFGKMLNNLDGKASAYDALFKKYADESGWDWRAIAAQGYVESKFKPNARSWAGARGIMQIMPGTARQYGLPQRKVTDPESNIRTSVKIITDLDRKLQRYVEDDKERRLFVTAAYNGGLGHVLDAIRLAEKYGKNPQLWYGNVETALKMKSNPMYYNDPVCRFGYFKGKETVAYVSEVEKIYDIYRHKLPS